MYLLWFYFQIVHKSVYVYLHKISHYYWLYHGFSLPTYYSWTTCIEEIDIYINVDKHKEK